MPAIKLAGAVLRVHRTGDHHQDGQNAHRAGQARAQQPAEPAAAPAIGVVADIDLRERSSGSAEVGVGPAARGAGHKARPYAAERCMAPGVHSFVVPLASRHEPVPGGSLAAVLRRLIRRSRRALSERGAQTPDMRDNSLRKLVRSKAGRFAARQKCPTQALRQKIVRLGVDTREGMRLFTLSRAPLYVAGDQWAAISGLIRGLPGLSRWWLRFLRDGAAKAEPRIGVADRRTAL